MGFIFGMHQRFRVRPSWQGKQVQETETTDHKPHLAPLLAMALQAQVPPRQGLVPVPLCPLALRPKASQPAKNKGSETKAKGKEKETEQTKKKASSSVAG